MRTPRIRLPSEETIREAALVAGFFMVAWGLWLVYPPATWIVCGAALVWLGLPPRRGK